MAENIPLHWPDGMFLQIDEMKFDRAALVDEVFLELLRCFTSENRYVSNNAGPTYAPTLFAEEAAARKTSINPRWFNG